MPSVGEYSGGTAESGSPSSPAMQSNGVIHENGTSTENGLSGVIKSNGIVCEREESGATAGRESPHIGGPILVRKRKQKHLSSKDTDIVRLIGQHLREMGFK